MKWFTRKKEVPLTNATQEIDVVEAYTVRWWSRHGNWEECPHMCSAQPEAEVFITKEEADSFAESLRKAFKILKYTGAGRKVTVEKVL